MGSILSTLAALLGAMATLFYYLEKRGGHLSGLGCGLLIAAAVPFWLIVSFSVYLLAGEVLAMFGLPRAPYLVRVLWPEALLPYAPFLAAAFGWWHTALLLPYFAYPEGATQEELRERRAWFRAAFERSFRWWCLGYLALWAAVQIVCRVPFFRSIPLPAPL